ncbi:type VI secretion system protein ImpK [Allofrancisella inopinata]|uniref:Type IV / VI secretion system DotU domain-containing protein n=1 Tax=Allofrancisella inopinata TaxID=1085647 RepID=A0AAE6YIU9_9GAMM|nr:DotU family type IV/VI secretion system protein [Allofrancisella inopinata]QIV96426.1 hypothetical protein E4K63_06125 [Allofrancisella inopinata]TDT73409.1 type VI secretion system protein ImpK [Allofrancisella inopinata]
MWKTCFFNIINAVDDFVPETQGTFDICRNTILSKINKLESIFLSENDTTDNSFCHLIIFATVAYCDELLSLKAIEHNFNYKPMQVELFNVANAGDVFYEYVDSILQRKKNLDFIYLIYYFLLEHGYRGRYDLNNPKRLMYIRQLAFYIKPTIKVTKFAFNQDTKKNLLWAKVPKNIFAFSSFIVLIVTFFVTQYI